MSGIKYSIIFFFIVIGHSFLWAHGDAHILIQKITAQLESDPDNPELYYNRGVLYQSHNDFNASFLDYHRVIELNPDFDPVNLKLSELCLANNLGKMALTYAEEYLVRRKHEAKAWVNRAKVYRFLGERELAMKDYISALDQSLVNPDYYYDLCNIILEVRPDDQQTAISFMRRAQKDIGDITGFRERIIDLELQRGNIDNALVELDLIIERSARTEKWNVRKGDILMQAGRTEEAMQAYQEAKIAIDKLPIARKQTDYIRELEARVDEALTVRN